MRAIGKIGKIKEEWSQKVIEWEKENGRDFYWRKNRTPYKVLVAEILLKRTTSRAASRLYQTFLERYPDIHSLAKAPEKELKTLLKDIGLYRQRSYQIKEMAKFIIDYYNIPPDY